MEIYFCFFMTKCLSCRECSSLVSYATSVQSTELTFTQCGQTLPADIRLCCNSSHFHHSIFALLPCRGTHFQRSTLHFPVLHLIVTLPFWIGKSCNLNSILTTMNAYCRNGTMQRSQKLDHPAVSTIEVNDHEKKIYMAGDENPDNIGKCM